MAILTVGGITLSDFALGVLKGIEDGRITYAQGKDEIMSKAIKEQERKPLLCRVASPPVVGDM